MSAQIPQVCAMLSQLKRNMFATEYPIQKISNNEEYIKAVEHNKNIYTSTNAITDTIINLSQLSKLKLDIIEIEKSTIKDCILSINHKGILQLTSHFLEAINLPIGTRLAPATNSANPTDKNIYFIQDKSGLKLTKNVLSIAPILNKFKIEFPTKVFWDVLEYQHKKGFQLIFS
jgi:hypothetical protein